MTAKRKVPKLRFPEFGGEWCLKEIKDHLEEYVDRVPSSTNFPILTSSRLGLFLQKNYFKDRELANEGEYGVVPYGYMTYRHMSDDSTFIFNINYLVEKGVVSKEYPVFKTKEMDIYFLQQVLNYGKTFKKFAVEQKRGGTRTRLYFKNLVNFRVHLPSLPEQQKIAAFLTTIDTRIQQLSRKKTLLEQYKKGVMQQIFSQETRFKDEDGKEFPAWEEKRLGEASDINPKCKNLPETFIYVDLESVEKGTLKKEERIHKEGAPSRAQRLLENGDILFQMVRPYQKNNLFFDKGEGYVASTGYAQIRTKNSQEYLFQFLHTDHFVQNVLLRCTGTSYPAINSNDLAGIKIALPSLPEQQKIAAFLSTIDRQINLVSQQLERMQTFKKGLLQRMFV